MSESTLDDGIFRTTSTGLIGGSRIDAQWLAGVNERAKRLRDAVKRQRETKQLRLPKIIENNNDF
jgi:hypothetical protein